MRWTFHSKLWTRSPGTPGAHRDRLPFGEERVGQADGRGEVVSPRPDASPVSSQRGPTGSGRGAGHGGLTALRISPAGHPSARRVPGTSRDQFLDTDDLDRPD